MIVLELFVIVVLSILMTASCPFWNSGLNTSTENLSPTTSVPVAPNPICTPSFVAPLPSMAVRPDAAKMPAPAVPARAEAL